MWRDVRWAVLGGGKLRVKEREGIWTSPVLGARVAKHWQMPEALTRYGFVPLNEHSQTSLRGR